MLRKKGPRLFAIAGLLGLTAPVLAAGEGSGTNNPDLHGLDAGPVAEAPPREGMTPFFDIDWSVGLRGAYTLESGGGEYSALATPELTLTHRGLRSDLVVTGSSELSIDAAGRERLSSLRLGADGAYALDEWSALAGNLDLSLTQADPDDPSLPANTAIAPLVFAGDASASATRKFGRFESRLRGSLGRTVNGETTLNDLSTIDNSAQNNWRAGTAARLGFEVTPLLTAFAEGGLEWQRFDAPDPSLLVYLDARTASVKTGLGYTLNSAFAAEGAVGVAWRDYDDASLTDAASLTTEGSVSFKPDETLSLTASLDTALAPSTSVPGDTVVSTDAAGNVTYTVNPWLGLRGSVTHGYDRIIGTGDVQQDSTLGVGLDYSVTDHAAFTADYLFTRIDAPPAPLSDSHMVAVGVKLSR
ncbi:MAG: outer membrane beta-barrel protein [Devosia sp.]